jgi:UDPglucose--hexose-1-phosphate uridylyltransferase
MSELRQRLTTREWVVIAPERLKGKKLQPQQNPMLDTIPEHSDNCPFCPGNEEKYPNVEIDRVVDEKDSASWKVLCLENKFKIFSNHIDYPLETKGFDTDGIYFKSIPSGRHELVIESPQHNHTFALMEKKHVASVVCMYLKRYNEIRKNPHILHTVIFKNHGPRSGASQQHPHSQIVAMKVAPNYIRQIVDEAQTYFDSNGICPFCKIIDYELNERKRLVYENDTYFSYTPYASTVPYEVEIFPKRHDALFGDMTDLEVMDFADCLRVTMRKLYFALSNPDFNIVFRNPPYHLCDVPFYHWHVKIAPHIVTPGGFELGSRMSVNVVSPEEAAEHLRKTDI